MFIVPMKNYIFMKVFMNERYFETAGNEYLLRAF